MQQPTRLGFRFRLGFGQRTTESGQRTADSGQRTVACGSDSDSSAAGRVAGKVLSEEKSSQVKSIQVKSAAATYSTWADFLSDLRTAKNIKLPQLPRQRSEVLRHFHLHSHPHPSPLPLLGKIGRTQEASCQQVVRGSGRPTWKRNSKSFWFVLHLWYKYCIW